jgi:hypothetical protein
VTDALLLLGSAPQRLASLVDGVSDDNLARSPAPGKWSIREIVAHLADAEIVIGYRLRLILASPGAAIQAFDQDAWALAGRYSVRNVSDSLVLFSAVRQANVALLRSLRDDEWERSGIHSERGTESLRDIASFYAGHDIKHFRQVESILRSAR